MRRKKGNFSNIVIDLTSLLDVVFILLMVVLLNGQVVSASLSEKSDELDTALQEAESAKENADEMSRLYDQGLGTIEGYGENLISVYASYDPSMVTKRHLRVLAMDEDMAEFDLTGGDVGDSLSAFRDYLSEYIQEHSGMPVVIALNKNDEYILYRDERALSDILSELSDEYPDVYLR